MSTTATTPSKVTVRRNGEVIVDGLLLGTVEKVGRDSWQALDKTGKALGCAWGTRRSAVQQLIRSEYAKTYAEHRQAAQPAAAEAEEATVVEVEPVGRYSFTVAHDGAVLVEGLVVGYVRPTERGLWSAWSAPHLCLGDDYGNRSVAIGAILERDREERDTAVRVIDERLAGLRQARTYADRDGDEALLKVIGDDIAALNRLRAGLVEKPALPFPDPVYGDLDWEQLDYRRRVYDVQVKAGEGIVNRLFGYGTMTDLNQAIENLGKLREQQARIAAELARREAAREAEQARREAAREAEQARQDWLIERDDR